MHYIKTINQYTMMNYGDVMAVALGGKTRKQEFLEYMERTRIYL